MTQSTDFAPRRLVLPSGEFAHLTGASGCELPPSWRPDPPEDPGACQHGLLQRRAMVADSTGKAQVQPSVAVNLDVLARAEATLNTTAHIGSKAVRCLHSVAGPFGASLFQLDGGEVEMSFFPATDLGKELLRAVPAEPEHAAVLDTLFHHEPLAGTLPLRVVEELGIATTLRSADPGGVSAVLRSFPLSKEQSKLAERLAEQTDGLLTCDMTGRTADGAVADRIVWLHAGGSWIGLRPSTGADGEQLVQLEPVQPGSLGVWAAGFLAAVLS